MDTTGRQQVIDVLHRRRKGERGPERLVLCIEGGGMRGVASAAMVLALHDLGFTADLFDAVYGASAGGLAGAYFIGGGMDTAMPRYYGDVPEWFLDWSRVVRRQPVLALERLIDDTVMSDPALSVGALLASGKLRLIASDIGATAKLSARTPQPVRAECFPAPASAAELRAYLLASTRIPLAGGPPVSVEDSTCRPSRRPEAHAYLDAFITEGLPVETPIAEGATHLAVLATKPYAMARAESALASGFTRWRLSRLNPNLPDQLRASAQRAGTRARLIDEGQSGAGNAPAIWCVSPTHDLGVPRLRPDIPRILSAAKAGYRLVREQLGMSAPVGFVTEPRFAARYATEHDPADPADPTLFGREPAP